MPFRQFDKVEWCGFTWKVAAYLQPSVLQDRHVDSGRALCDGVKLRSVTSLRDPQLDTHHRSITNTPVELAQAEVEMVGVQIDKAKRAVRPRAQGFQHLVVCFTQLFRRRILHERHTQRQYEALHSEPMCILTTLGHPLFWRF